MTVSLNDRQQLSSGIGVPRRWQGDDKVCCFTQGIYPVTSCRAVSTEVNWGDREAIAAAMRQSMVLLQWAHMFDAAEHTQRAERFLCKRMQSMAGVRPPCARQPLHARPAHRCETSLFALCRRRSVPTFKA